MKGPRRCIDYRIIETTDRKGLVTLVHQQLGQGWEPVGGVAVEVDLDGAGSTFYQAMAQFTEKEPFT